jgi:hypothetical protein
MSGSERHERPKPDLGGQTLLCAAALPKRTLLVRQPNGTSVTRALFGQVYTVRYQDVVRMVDERTHGAARERDRSTSPELKFCAIQI